MIKHFYFIDPEGDFYSEDGTTRYRRETGKVGAITARYMRETMDVRFIESKIGDVLCLVEVGQAFLNDYRKYERHEQYIRDSKNESDLIFLSLDHVREEDGEELLYHEVIACDNDLEEKILVREKLAVLDKSLSTLNKEEMEIIRDLYLTDEPMTEREYARYKGIPQKTMNNRKIAILKKLKKFFENDGSN